MTKLALILAFAVLAAGCGMSGPGVARVTAAPPSGYDNDSTYNNSWVTKEEPDAVNSMEPGQELSIDISDRELGVRYFDEDTTIEGGYVPAYVKRRNERRDARRKAWKEKLGITNIKDEQEDD